VISESAAVPQCRVTEGTAMTRLTMIILVDEPFAEAHDQLGAFTIRTARGPAPVPPL
jgi:hypothetical protein